MWRRHAVTALVASVAAATTDGVYQAVIRSQDASPPHPAVVPFLMVYIAAVAVAGAASVALILQDHRGTAQMLWWLRLPASPRSGSSLSSASV
jgi:hypothetical protein